MKNQILITAAAVLLISGCSGNQESMNPFFSEYNTPFGVPPFQKIENKHFLPAFEEGIRQQQQEIDDIITCMEVPDFNNTIAAFDQSGSLLRKVGGVFYKLRSAETCDEIDSIAELLVPLTSGHKSNMMLNEDLFKRIKTVYDNRENENLNQEQSRAVSYTHLTLPTN